MPESLDQGAAIVTHNRIESAVRMSCSAQVGGIYRGREQRENY